MSIFDALPLLKGWRWEAPDITKTITKKKKTLFFEQTRPGWLLGLTLIAYDAYAKMEIWLQNEPFATVLIEDGHLVGANLPSNFTFWLSTYNRPSPLVTNGLYLAAMTPANPVPFKPDVLIYGELTSDSTQSETTMTVSPIGVVITDMDEFIKSYKELMGIK